MDFFRSSLRVVSTSLACAAIAEMGGCARPLRVPRPAPASAELADVRGVWDGVGRFHVGEDAIDTRTDRQEWHLDQAGSEISGYYVVELTVVSGDGRPYVCNQEPSFQSVMRFEVRGVVSDARLVLEEVGQEAGAGRCTVARDLDRYQGELRGNVLTLVSAHNVNAAGDGARWTLYRRARTVAGAEAPFAPPPHAWPPSDLASAPTSPGVASSSASFNLSGVWTWEHLGVIPGGDEKREREEWHITQEGTSLSGYYDRLIRQVSTDGHAYRCNNTLEFHAATRYRFEGEIRGDRVTIRESKYDILDPNPCDNGVRRLDVYLGQATGDEIRLVWGAGGQILRRAPPDVPTQRF